MDIKYLAQHYGGMRAVSQRSLGGPEVLEVVDVPQPTPESDQVLVKVHAAGVNAGDWKIRSGAIRRYGEPPFTVGLDFSGVVEEVGGPGIALVPGDEVYGVTYPPHGSYAEYVAVPAESVARKPSGVDHVAAAALPVCSLTAWQALVKVGEISAGQRVLIHAAAGGVGHLAVQIAKNSGAYVIGTARQENHAFLREIGADEVIDYTAVDFTTVVSGVDVVLDPIAGEYGVRSLDTLVPGGLLIDIRGSGPDRTVVGTEAEARGVRYIQFGFKEISADLEQIAKLVQSGALRASIERVMPLAEAVQAHRIMETGRSRGKIVLTV